MTIESKPKYRKRLRAEQEAQTRRRITEAAVKLHGTVGPASTTVAGIAKEAGVQRATVYRHFPTEDAIYEACTAHYMSLHPPPDPTGWGAIRDPDARLRTALEALYPFYAETAPMLTTTQRDAEHLPASVNAANAAYLEFIREALLKGRRERGRRRERVRAALDHAIAFSTWSSLVGDGGLTDAEAIDLVAGMVGAA